MTVDTDTNSDVARLTAELVDTYPRLEGIHHLGHRPLPNRKQVLEALADLLDLLFPGYGRKQSLHLGTISDYATGLVAGLLNTLTDQIARALRHEATRAEADPDVQRLARAKTREFLGRLPRLRETLARDVRAAYQSDPAAKSYDEIVFTYPGIEAVATHRLAHELLHLGVPFIPRMLSEAAHARTGIDIHPGAEIGPGFFIDHGTGVVIGETCVIGSNVKLYQGVTLGTLNFRKDADGNVIRGTKRHPTIEDEVVIYANATVLGGTTVIGHHSAIGSNVWLTHSVEPYTLVTLEKPSLRIRSRETIASGIDFQI